MVGKFILWFAVSYILVAAEDASQPYVPKDDPIKKWCVRNSGSEAGYEKMLKSGSVVEKCIGQVIDKADFEQEPTTENKIKQVKKYCPRSGEWLKCFEHPLDGIALCLGGNDLNQAKHLVDEVVGELAKKLCENDSEYFVELYKPEYAQCLDQLWKMTLECAIEPEYLSLLEMGCPNLEAVRSCFQQRISSCGAPTNVSSIILQTFVRPIFRFNNCTESPDSK
ncbi:uncharacterized protein LOC129757318 [Uranotaenia lowii]|uniref:uncharacterized protein LOC129757318 n=1 Tax=Uranotaenia lowii TaxID=190385 RepID=UPI002478BF44|nr:uncharacterized protein LOC129757318 [Uranotaenia lowii]